MFGRAPQLKRLCNGTAPDHVVAVTWSFDGAVAAAASTGPVVVFDGKTGETRHTLPGHAGGTFAAAFPTNGNVLATAGQDGHVRFWRGGAELAATKLPAAWVEKLEWSPDGTKLAVGAGKCVSIFDRHGVKLAELPKQSSTVAALAWKPGGEFLAVVPYGGVYVFPVENPVEPVQKFEWRGAPLVAAFSPDGKYLAHGNQDSTVHFWNVAASTPLQMSGYPSKITTLSWDPASRYLATGGSDAVCVWDCGGKGPEGTKPAMLEYHPETITAVAYQRRGQLLASAARDGSVAVWQPGNRRQPVVAADKSGAGEAVLAWSPDDRFLAAGFASGAVAVYKVA